MVTCEKSIIIHRPIEEVFAYVSDLQNGPEWQSGLLEAQRTSAGPLGVGTQFTSVRKFMGRRVESGIEFTAYEPNTKISYKGISGPSPFEESFSFESTAEGTKLTTLLVLQTGGLIGLAEPLIASGVRREMDANFGDLKDMLESRAPAVSS